MLLHRHPFADRSNQVQINLARGNTGRGNAYFVDSSSIQDDNTPRIDDETMAVGFSLGIMFAVLRSGYNVALILNRSCCQYQSGEINFKRNAALAFPLKVLARERTS